VCLIADESTEPKTKEVEKEQTKAWICSEVSVSSPGIRGVGPDEEKGYGGKDLW